MTAVKVIVNPYANRSGSRRQRATIYRAFEHAGVAVDLEETTGPGHASMLAQAACAAGFGTIIAAGGDGTISEVVDGLMRTPLNGSDKPTAVLGLLPLGSGNDFAHTLGYPRNAAWAACKIAAGHRRWIDVGQLTIRVGAETQTRYFVNSLGIGLEAHVVILSERLTRLGGALRYLAASMIGVLSYRTSTVRLFRYEPKEQTLYDGIAHMVTIGNGARSGGGFYLTPDARVDDGWLDVGVVQGVARWRLLQLLPRARNGSHITDAAIFMYRGQHLRVLCTPGCPVHADGEIVAYGATEIEVRVLPGVLSVIV